MRERSTRERAWHVDRQRTDRKNAGHDRGNEPAGVGTTYVFRLPFYIDCEGQRIQEVKTRIAGKELVHFHVLLVEDNEINMEIAEFYLTDHGATVEEAWNGREAVEKYAANPQKFDVILMDLMMPVMGGLEAARQIRAMELPEAKQVPIIPMTAQSSEESKEGCRAAGMNSHLTKPIEPDSLVQTILETTEHAFGNRGENDEFYAFTCTYRIQPSGRIEQDQRVRCQSQGAWHEQRRDHRSRRHVRLYRFL
mgnify:CR=1 FL=1